ncbi:U11/U12 small nuclear ribonucleoprotein 25 kDa protein [Bienertia sinuspersici]
MRRSSFKVANDDDEVFGGGREGLSLPRVSYSSSSKSRRSFCRSSSSVSTALSLVSSRKSFSYDKLAQAPIHLTVVKLDGSRFVIEVMKMATVADLKQAVESAFSHLPTKGPGKISWRHVWTQFCLSYCGQKLLNDKEYIKNYGVKDGDELRFVRHVSIAYNLIKKRSTKRIEAPKPDSVAETYEEETAKVDEATENDRDNTTNQVELKMSHNETTVPHSFKGLFLYSRLSSTEQLKFERQANHQSRWVGGFVGCLRSLFHFCDKRHPSYCARVSQVEI